RISDRFERILKPLVSRQFKRVPNTFIIRLEIKKSGDNSAITSMAFIRPRKRIVKSNLCLVGPGTQEAPGDASDPHHPGSVRAGGTNHHGPDHIKYTTFFRHVLIQYAICR